MAFPIPRLDCLGLIEARIASANERRQEHQIPRLDCLGLIEADAQFQQDTI